jgi:molybdate transport system substrate-binding protein
MPDIQLISTTAMKSTLDDVVASFERSSGHKVVPSFGPSPRLTKQIAEGAVCDAVIVGAQNINDLIEQGKIIPGTGCAIGASPIALAVQKGAPQPDISTPEKFAQALLAAKSIAQSNPVGGGTSGGILMRAYERLGNLDAIKPKLTFGAGGPAGLVGHYLVRKEIEIGIQQMSELMMVPGIDVVGPLPEGVQSVTVFTGGISTGAKNQDGAAALLKFLRTPEVAAVVRSKGMEIPP